MAITALHAAATGLRALSTRIDITANNLANAETNAFKRQRANFEDLMYIMQKQPGAQNSAGDVSPTGIYVGMGTKLSNTQLDLEQGSLEPTGSQYDVSIRGKGFFRVSIMSTVGDGTGYTRNGNFVVNRDGELMLNVGEGYKLVPPVQIPPDATEVSISEEGIVSASIPGQQEKEQVGALRVYQFVNPQGLHLAGGSLYLETEASGPANESQPGADGAGILQQGFLESSNVDPVKELVGLIKTQRAFELNSQSIQSADQALQTIGNLRRN